MKSKVAKINKLITNKQIKILLIEKKKTESNLTGDWARLIKNNQVINNQKRDFDPKALYSAILTSENNLLKLKLAAIAANIGYKNLEALPKDCNYYNIYKLSNLELRKVKLEELLKFTRNEQITTNKQPLIYHSVYTKGMVYNLISETQAEIDVLKEKILAFNEGLFDLNDLPF